VKVRASGKDREEMKRMATSSAGASSTSRTRATRSSSPAPAEKLDAFLEIEEAKRILEAVRTGASGIGRGRSHSAGVAVALNGHGARSRGPGQTSGPDGLHDHGSTWGELT
jgi:hypothetical protein